MIELVREALPVIRVKFRRKMHLANVTGKLQEKPCVRIREIGVDRFFHPTWEEVARAYLYDLHIPFSEEDCTEIQVAK